jgi:hypothetical protein
VPEGEMPVYIKVRPDSLESMIRYSAPAISKNKKRAVALINSDKLIENIKNRSEILVGMLPWIILVVIIISEVSLWRRPPEKLT